MKDLLCHLGGLELRLDPTVVRHCGGSPHVLEHPTTPGQSSVGTAALSWGPECSRDAVSWVANLLNGLYPELISGFTTIDRCFTLLWVSL